MFAGFEYFSYLPDQSASFILKRVIQIMCDNFVEFVALEISFYFGLVLSHYAKLHVIDDLVAAFVTSKWAVSHLELSSHLQPRTVIRKKYAVAFVKHGLPVWSPAINLIFGIWVYKTE